MVSLSSISGRASRKVSDHFAGAGATDAGSAVNFIPTSKSEKKALTRLQRKRVVSLAEGGRHWIDQEKAESLRRSDQARTAAIAGGLIAAAAALLALRARTRSDRTGDRGSSKARTG